MIEILGKESSLLNIFRLNDKTKVCKVQTVFTTKSGESLGTEIDNY